MGDNGIEYPGITEPGGVEHHYADILESPMLQCSGGVIRTISEAFHCGFNALAGFRLDRIAVIRHTGYGLRRNAGRLSHILHGNLCWSRHLAPRLSLKRQRSYRCDVYHVSRER